MRSKAFTIVWLLLALSCGALAFVQLTRNDLSSIFGNPPVAESERLLKFEPVAVRGIQIEANGEKHNYSEKQGQWILQTDSAPDRADYRALEALLACMANLSVLESFPATSENRARMGLSQPRARIQLGISGEERVTSFTLGKKGAWHLQVPSPDKRTPPRDYPSIYIQPENSEFIYLCSSPYLEDMFANGFGNHRDLRPFFFPPELLAEVTISKPNGDLVLSRPAPTAAWGIEKPFELEANPKATSRLVGGLYQLAALEASHKPAPPAQDPEMSLSLRFFALDGSIQEQAITLALSEPATGGDEIYLGRLDDWRKDIAFTIPRQTTDSLPGVEELPLTLDELRGTRLSGLNLKRLESLTISSPSLEGQLQIFIEKSPISGEWRARRRYQGETIAANEGTFFTVKKALSEEEAIATASESASNLGLYGLAHPAKTVTLELFDGTTEVLHFGFETGKDGTPRYYFRRNDSRIVMEITSETFFEIAARPYLWRGARAWNFDIFDLSILRLDRPGGDPLVLQYSDLSQTWSARQGERDVTALLNENRANRYLETLSNLKVTQWLATDHQASQDALAAPLVTITAFFKRPDDPEAPIRSQVLELAGSSTPGENRFYFGRVKGDAHPFILDLATVGKLAVPLLEKEE
jgi:hypothetical protein